MPNQWRTIFTEISALLKTAERSLLPIYKILLLVRYEKLPGRVPLSIVFVFNSPRRRRRHRIVTSAVATDRDAVPVSTLVAVVHQCRCVEPGRQPPRDTVYRQAVHDVTRSPCRSRLRSARSWRLRTSRPFPIQHRLNEPQRVHSTERRQLLTSSLSQWHSRPFHSWTIMITTDAASLQRCSTDISAVRRACDLYDGLDCSVDDLHVRWNKHNVSDDRFTFSMHTTTSCSAVTALSPVGASGDTSWNPSSYPLVPVESTTMAVATVSSLSRKF